MWYVDHAPVDGHIARAKMDLMGYQKREKKRGDTFLEGKEMGWT